MENDSDQFPFGSQTHRTQYHMSKLGGLHTSLWKWSIRNPHRVGIELFWLWGGINRLNDNEYPNKPVI